VESVREPLRELLANRTTVALILALLLYKVGDAFALKLFTPFLMDVGFNLTEIGLVSKFVMTSGAVLGALLGGLAMVRWTLAQSLVVFGVCQAVSNLAYWAVAIVGKNYAAMVGAVFVDSLASGMGNVAIVAWIMALCNKRFSAFQYALLSAIAVIPRTYLGPPAGYIADNYGWASFYVLSFAIALPGLFLVWFWRDKVASLDTSK
jgi:PAT family beta-lactamase induction signal transducer AmpG